MLTLLRSGFFLVAVLAALAGCGAGSSTASSSSSSSGGSTASGGSTTGTTAAIQGIATPSSVSVVTATNAE
jgi:hypothetical protein